MKKTFHTFGTLSIAFLLVALSSTVALAQEASPTPATRGDQVQQNSEARQAAREERRLEIEENVEERQENRQELRAEIEANVEERQENRQERRADIAGRHADRLENRFGFYEGRLNALIAKLQTRLVTLSNSGVDTAEAQAKLNEALTTLSKAVETGDAAISAFNAIQPDEFEAQKTQAQAARDLAVEAREGFKSTVALMREAVDLARDAAQQ